MNKPVNIFRLISAILGTLLVLSIVFLTWVIVGINRQDRNLPEKADTDTVYVNRFFDSEPDFKFTQIPERVFVFFSDITEVEKVELVRDTVFVYQKDSNPISYSTQFLTQYTQSPKLIQMNLSDKLKLTLMNPNGKVYQEVYPIDLNRFEYLYSDRLSYQRKSFWKRWTPFVQFQVRPFHSWVDLDFGLSYKTSNFNYEFGINGFYYHHLNNPVGADLFLRIRYEF